VRYLIPHAWRIADAPFDAVPQISWGNTVLASTYRGMCSRVLKGRSEQAILLGCPLLLQLWCHKKFTIGRPVVSLHLYEALLEGQNPSVHFTMGSLWCLWMIISYLSLSICLSILSSLFNPHFGFTFRLYAGLVRSRADEEGAQGLHRSVRLSHGCGRQVDIVLRGGYRDPCTTGPLAFVFLRSTLLDD
jgi:hypothetical protein